MIVNWYVEVNGPYLKNNNYLKSVIETAKPFMRYFCERLSLINDWKVEDAQRIFGDIIDEMPIMNYRVSSDTITGEKEFIIMYNKHTDIKLTDTTKQIYREIKLEKILV